VDAHLASLLRLVQLGADLAGAQHLAKEHIAQKTHVAVLCVPSEKLG
jgi:hypothetical protein